MFIAIRYNLSHLSQIILLYLFILAFAVIWFMSYYSTCCVIRRK